MGPRLRKVALTAHVASSVGWLGGVIVYLCLGVVGLTADDRETVQAVYLAMDAAAWTVLVPLATATTLTGIVQSLGTPWGLLRHYWVITKLVISLVATVVLVLYTGTLEHLAHTARAPGVHLTAMRSASPVLHAGAAAVLLLGATALSVFKPRGLTRRGHRVLVGR